MIYNIAIYILGIAINIASIFNKKARLLKAGRRNILQHIEHSLDEIKNSKHSASVFWMHCASLGEFEQGRPVLEQYKSLHPKAIIVLTFFSPSGYEMRKNYEYADAVFYLPADTKRNARHFVEILKPDIAVFVKYEFWINILSQLKKSSIQTYIISAIFRPGMIFFKPWGGAYRRVLKCFTHIFVQNNESATLLSNIGVNNVTVAGDTRFDRVMQIVSMAKKLPLIEEFINSQSDVMVCGSVWENDMAVLIPFIINNPQIKFIIAPHQIDDNQIDIYIKELKDIKSVKYIDNQPNSDIFQYANVLFINTIGLLSSVYQYGTIAYIGGGFGAGIHNILEAATWGLPTIFGAKYTKFAEAIDLIEQQGAFVINNTEELEQTYVEVSSGVMGGGQFATIARDYVMNNTGATQQFIDFISKRD